jgi:hypothetical protein
VLADLIADLTHMMGQIGSEIAVPRQSQVKLARTSEPMPVPARATVTPAGDQIADRPAASV